MRKKYAWLDKIGRDCIKYQKSRKKIIKESIENRSLREGHEMKVEMTPIGEKSIFSTKHSLESCGEVDKKTIIFW